MSDTARERPRRAFSYATRVAHRAGAMTPEGARRPLRRLAEAYLAGTDTATPGSGRTQRYSHDLRSNGESELVRRLGSGLRVVFDVGANVGDWTAMVLEHAAHATIHAFELSPPTAETLAARFRDEPRVVVRPFGLAEETADVAITHYDGAPALTSMVDYPHGASGRTITAHVERGDAYVDAHAVGRVDLLKIDAEGAESRVLAGLAGTIERGGVRVIQFEYGRVCILTKFLLRDFYAVLDGYRIGRLTPAGVQFHEYAFELETFQDSNWVAVRRNEPELAAALEA